MCVVRDREGRKSPGYRRRQQHTKPSESSSLSSSVVNQHAVSTGSDKENAALSDNADADYDDDDDVVDGDVVADVQTDREIHELSKMTDSGAAKVFLEDLRKKKLEKASLDPRSSSRTPSAAAEPPFRPRYDSPLFACESVHVTHRHGQL